MHTCMHRIHNIRTYINTCIPYIHTCINMHARIYAYVRTCMRTCVHEYITYMTFKHKNTQAYLHTLHACMHYIHQYIKLDYVALRYITSHYIELHYIDKTLHDITLQDLSLHYITLHYNNFTSHLTHTYTRACIHP